MEKVQWNYSCSLTIIAGVMRITERSVKMRTVRCEYRFNIKSIYEASGKPVVQVKPGSSMTMSGQDIFPDWQGAPAYLVQLKSTRPAGFQLPDRHARKTEDSQRAALKLQC
jgi:hypothetical protein